jgi:hypothetical protein
VNTELLVGGAALIVSLVALGLHLFQLKRDPNVPEIGGDDNEYDSWTGV